MPIPALLMSKASGGENASEARDEASEAFLKTRAFYDTAFGGRIFFEKRVFMQIKLFTIPVGDSGGALQEMNAFLRGNKILEVEHKLIGNDLAKT